MENNSYNRDFEQFVKQNADQYRMFPSEKVWEGINNTLHTRRRWYGIGLSLLLLTTGIVTWVMLLNPAGKKQSVIVHSAAFSSKKLVAPKSESAEPVIFIATPKSSGSKNIEGGTAVTQLPDNLFLADVTIPLSEVEEQAPVILQSDIIPVAPTVISQPEFIAAQSTTSSVKQIVQNRPSINNLIVAVKPAVQDNADNIIATYTDLNPVPTEENAEEKVADVAAEKEKSIYPLTIESVINSYQKIASRRKLSWQIYFLPTVSYRILTENKGNLINSQQVISNITPGNTAIPDNVKSAVTHKPDIGLELGFNVAYPVAKNVKVTAGLQFNVSKYDIKAYPYPVEQANIVLNNTNGSASISRIETNYRNFESYTKADWLSNFYISASLPVGLEMNLTDTRKNTYLGIGGTLQPTYILGDRAYLISTDFKNYAKVPSLIRGWNVSTSFEVFAGYTTGKINWKVGPQVRYQMLSSFAKAYPVKEHIIDFGLKVGVILR